MKKIIELFEVVLPGALSLSEQEQNVLIYKSLIESFVHIHNVEGKYVVARVTVCDESALKPITPDDAEFNDLTEVINEITEEKLGDIT